MPVSSCESECQRKISCLRRLSNYMRASVGHQRLPAIALMHIHYSLHVDAAAVVDTFTKRQLRRLELLHWALWLSRDFPVIRRGCWSQYSVISVCTHSGVSRNWRFFDQPFTLGLFHYRLPKRHTNPVKGVLWLL